MRILLALLLLSAGKQATSQTWHQVTDTVRLPRGSGHMHSTAGFYNRYDTVPCTYTVAGSTTLQKGYKFVYVLTGFYIDSVNTINVFFDERLNRIYNVERFYFN